MHSHTVYIASAALNVIQAIILIWMITRKSTLKGEIGLQKMAREYYETEARHWKSKYESVKSVRKGE